MNEPTFEEKRRQFLANADRIFLTTNADELIDKVIGESSYGDIQTFEGHSLDQEEPLAVYLHNNGGIVTVPRNQTPPVNATRVQMDNTGAIYPYPLSSAPSSQPWRARERTLVGSMVKSHKRGYELVTVLLSILAIFFFAIFFAYADSTDRQGATISLVGLFGSIIFGMISMKRTK